MKYYLKIQPGKTNYGVTYNKVVDGAESNSPLYSPWIEATQVAYNNYKNAITNPQSTVNSYPDAFVDCVIENNKITNIAVSRVPPDVTLIPD